MQPEQTTEASHETGSGQFKLDRFAVRRAVFEELARAPRDEHEKRPDRLTINVNIKGGIELDEEGRRAVVTLDVHVIPDLKWQPYRIEVEVAGYFRGENVSVEQFDQFCKYGVPPILFPYVREIVHRLTMDARYGVVRIQPINIAALISKTPWSMQP